MTKTMNDVSIGERFTVAGIEYIKTSEVRVSCCKVINCEAVGNPNQKNYFSPNIEVEVNG
jgi:hypothetical protein